MGGGCLCARYPCRSSRTVGLGLRTRQTLEPLTCGSDRGTSPMKNPFRIAIGPLTYVGSSKKHKGPKRHSLSVGSYGGALSYDRGEVMSSVRVMPRTYLCYSACRGTSPINISAPLDYASASALCERQGGGPVSYEQGTPVHPLWTEDLFFLDGVRRKVDTRLP